MLTFFCHRQYTVHSTEYTVHSPLQHSTHYAGTVHIQYTQYVHGTHIHSSTHCTACDSTQNKVYSSAQSTFGSATIVNWSSVAGTCSPPPLNRRWSLTSSPVLGAVGGSSASVGLCAALHVCTWPALVVRCGSLLFHGREDAYLPSLRAASLQTGHCAMKKRLGPSD